MKQNRNSESDWPDYDDDEIDSSISRPIGVPSAPGIDLVRPNSMPSTINPANGASDVQDEEDDGVLAVEIEEKKNLWSLRWFITGRFVWTVLWFRKLKKKNWLI